MKITSNNLTLPVDAKVQAQPVADKAKADVEVSEVVSVSQAARSIQSDQKLILQKLEGVDDVRMEKVNRIKQEIESGTYKRDPQAVADKMIAAHLSESLHRK